MCFEILTNYANYDPDVLLDLQHLIVSNVYGQLDKVPLVAFLAHPLSFGQVETIDKLKDNFTIYVLLTTDS